MSPALDIRRVRLEDAEALLAIYRPLVEETAVSFEMQPPDLGEFQDRIRQALTQWEWLVAVADGQVSGYAYGTAYRPRAAYRYSVEVSVYVHPNRQRSGIAEALYRELLGRLKALGYCNAYAGIALPNDASIALHRKLGFAPVGLFRQIGWKFGRWHDIWMWHLRLAER